MQRVSGNTELLARKNSAILDIANPVQNLLQKLAREDMHRKKYSTSCHKTTRIFTAHDLPSHRRAASHDLPRNSPSEGKKWRERTFFVREKK
jgi:hypothetical protein